MDTTASRAIVIELKRKLASDSVADFRHVDDFGLEELRQQLMRWTSDNADVLANASPSLPHGVVNRVAANWHLLLAIADAAGGEWSEKGREAGTQASAPHHRVRPGVYRRWYPDKLWASKTSHVSSHC